MLLTFAWKSFWNLWKGKREEVWKKAKRTKEKRVETKEDEGEKARKPREGQNQRKGRIGKPTKKLKDGKNWRKQGSERENKWLS